MRNKAQELFSLTNSFYILKKDNNGTKQLLNNTKDILKKIEVVLENIRQNLAEETILRKAYQATEEQLNNVNKELILILKWTVDNIGGLYSKIKRKFNLQSLNYNKWQAL